MARLSALLRPEARVYIWEMNPDFLWLAALNPHRRALPRPAGVAGEFRRHGFSSEVLRGAASVPYRVWNRLPAPLASMLDDAGRKVLRLSFSYVFGARRGA